MAPETPCGTEQLLSVFGRIDIYVFDQLLKGRLTGDMRVLDAGCGGGRNSAYLMRCGADVFGVDADPEQVRRMRQTAAEAGPSQPADQFRLGRLEDLPWPDGHFDAVLCSAVLHFSETHEVFARSVREMWRVLKPGGLFFARLASNIGMETAVRPLQEGWFRLPDGSDRYLVTEADLMRHTEILGGELLDPLKTTVVQNTRSMTTWVLRKPVGTPA